MNIVWELPRFYLMWIKDNENAYMHFWTRNVLICCYYLRFGFYGFQYLMYKQCLVSVSAHCRTDNKNIAYTFACFEDRACVHGFGLLWFYYICYFKMDICLTVYSDKFNLLPYYLQLFAAGWNETWYISIIIINMWVCIVHLRLYLYKYS